MQQTTTSLSPSATTTTPPTSTTSTEAHGASIAKAVGTGTILDND
ncbi:MAG: hypothetical protein OXH10_02220 [bacterium]|nr:hypothetical protein [bacterium]MCY3580489.1 hypothetical protein [bacterium]MDE0644020.1 hypothetical protein [bacterium]